MDPQNPAYHFPSGPPVPPYQFYGAPPPNYGPAPGDMGFDRPHPAPSAPTERARSQSPDSAPSPATVPVKRGRGRPPGSGKKKEVAAKTAAKVAVVKSKAPSVKQTKKSKKIDEEKENEVPIEIDDSDSEAEGGNKYTHWANHEKTNLFSFILAFDDTGNHRFEQLKKNPARVFKRASEILFPAGNRSAKSIQNLWTCSTDTYTWIRTFEGFTGNGGGDPDSEDATAILAHRLKAARTASLTIGKLKPETIILWEKQGWLDLFNARYGNNAKVTRTVVRNSSSAISDIDEDNDMVLADNSDDTIDPVLRALPKTPAPRKGAAAVVSEQKHTPASQLRTQANNSFGNLGEFMKIKMASEEKKTKVIESRLELDRAKLELEQSRAKVEEEKSKGDMARAVLSTPGMSDEVKAAATGFLLNLFK